ncbi:hypothetical protein BKA25_005267 [Actinoalloteichus hymeniacidonis]|uniref:Uncharacterized protein n=1 Tax=Actinoalloteichus hymeniacidonis TaxID=340345 RepID=A0AAC9MWG0_9PSEU|nr:hypothetical protein TL08_01025 [Actinoalloteichus hymeniacidonis]MBB5910951.1 hypothetical protein [Actinoalloteichus hymeniacidonis]
MTAAPGYGRDSGHLWWRTSSRPCWIRIHGVLMRELPFGVSMAGKRTLPLWSEAMGTS